MLTDNPEPDVRADATSDELPDIAWTTTTRTIASLILLAFLFVVLLGPLSNPIPSRNLTGPASEAFSGVHRAMFLGHGYRFFGPDPGASHIIQFTITSPDGKVLSGNFPDRKHNRPRLMYHRWFMLSETIYQEFAALYSIPFEDLEAEMTAASEGLKRAGQFKAAVQLAREKQEARRQFDDSVKRFGQLVAAVADQIQSEHEGSQVELFLVERAIATPLDVVGGISLDDPIYLTEPVRIWPVPELPRPLSRQPESPPLLDLLEQANPDSGPGLFPNSNLPLNLPAAQPDLNNAQPDLNNAQPDLNNAQPDPAAGGGQ